MANQTSNTQQAASVSQPAEFPASLPSVTGGGMIATGVSLVAGLLWLRRRLSRDSLEVAKDASEKRLLSVITEERDRAVAVAEAAWATRTEDARLIGQLTSEVKHLTEANRNLISDVSGMREEIVQLKEIIYSLIPPDIADRMRKSANQPYAEGIREAMAQRYGNGDPI